MAQPSIGLNQLVLTTALETRFPESSKSNNNSAGSANMAYAHDSAFYSSPPGCGKTITAHALAHKLGLPLS